MLPPQPQFKQKSDEPEMAENRKIEAPTDSQLEELTLLRVRLSQRAQARALLRWALLLDVLEQVRLQEEQDQAMLGMWED
ncbi:hypothetical protein N7453_002345 [Penicillium expansum]|nr:hypothetical protein N7453_002345 [Penicillium expansum]